MSVTDHDERPDSHDTTSRPSGVMRRELSETAAAPSSVRPKRTRVTLQLPEELVDRMRDAAYWLSGPPHQLTLTAIAEQALNSELERIKRDLNDGKDFQQRTGRLNRGRPIGS